MDDDFFATIFGILILPFTFIFGGLFVWKFFTTFILFWFDSIIKTAVWAWSVI